MKITFYTVFKPKPCNICFYSFKSQHTQQEITIASISVTLMEMFGLTWMVFGRICTQTSENPWSSDGHNLIYKKPCRRNQQERAQGQEVPINYFCFTSRRKCVGCFNTVGWNIRFLWGVFFFLVCKYNYIQFVLNTLQFPVFLLFLNTSLTPVWRGSMRGKRECRAVFMVTNETSLTVKSVYHVWSS